MPKFVVLKAPSVGLGSLMVITICGRLYARLTDRIPISLWRQNCLYYEPTESSDKEGDNAFEYFFEPLSECKITDLTDKEYSYYPDCWNAENIQDDFLLRQNDQARFWLPVDPESPEYKADVLVVSEYLGITQYLPKLLRACDRFQGLSELEVLSRCFYRQLELKLQLQHQVNKFYQTHFQGFVSIGLRIRKTDFAASRAVPSDQMYIDAVNARIASVGKPTKIFLATDCAKTAKKFKQIYSDQLIYTDCIRSQDTSAVHLSGGSGRQKGEQMLLDLYLLANCDYFIGSDSNWVWLVTRILRNPLVNPERNTVLAPTSWRILQKRIELLSREILRSIYYSLKTVTRFLIPLA